MERFLSWGLKVGRLAKIDIHLHFTFIIYAFLTLLSSFKDGGLVQVPIMLSMMLILFSIVLAHEFGHCTAARKMGGFAEKILMWPLGGLAYVQVPNTARKNFWVAAGGPFVNIILLALLLPVKIIVGGGLLDIQGGYSAYTFFQMLWSINLFLLIFNLLPAYPMDGGRLLQCFLWARKGYKKATEIVTITSMIIAGIMASYGFVYNTPMLFVLAAFIFFQAWQTRQMLKAGEIQDDTVFGYDFSQGNTSLDRSYETTRPKKKTPLLTRIKMFFLKKRMEKKGKEEADIRAEADRLLQKIHVSGMESLTKKEKKILDKYSKLFKK